MSLLILNGDRHQGQSQESVLSADFSENPDAHAGDGAFPEHGASQYAEPADEPAAAGTDAGAEFTGHVEHDHGLLESEAGFRRQNLPGPFRGNPGRQQLPDHLWAQRRCERDGGSRLPGPVRRCLWRLRYSAGSGVLEPE